MFNLYDAPSLFAVIFTDNSSVVTFSHDGSMN